MNLRDFVIKDFWWKLGSFLLAVIIWGVVKGELRKSDDGGVPAIVGEFKKLPVTLLRDPGDLRPLRVVPKEVAVFISGVQAQLKNVKAEQIEVFVKLADGPNLNGAPIKLTVTAPPGISIISVVPPVASVTIRDSAIDP